MAKLGAFLETLFEKAGIIITDELNPLITADIDIPEDIASQVDYSLVTRTQLNETLNGARHAFDKKEGELKATVKNLDGTRAKDQRDFAMYKKLLGKDYALPKEMDNDIKVSTAMTAINLKLQAMGVIAKLNDAGDLVITDKDGNKAYTEKHEAIDNVDSFFHGILTQSGLLESNEQGKQQQQRVQAASIIIPGVGKFGNPTIVAEIEASLF